MFTSSIDEYCEEVLTEDPFKSPLYLDPENEEDLEWIIFLTSDQLATQREKKPQIFPNFLRELIFFDDFEGIDPGITKTKEEYLVAMEHAKRFFLKHLHDLIVNHYPDEIFACRYIDGLTQYLTMDDNDAIIAAGKLWASNEEKQILLSKSILDTIVQLSDDELVAVYDNVIRPALDKKDSILASGLFNGMRLMLTKDANNHIEWLNRPKMTEDEYADFLIQYKKENERHPDDDDWGLT